MTWYISHGHAVTLPHLDGGVTSKTHYAPIRIQCVIMLVNKVEYNEFSIISNKQIRLYFFYINHDQLNLVYFPLRIVQNV